MASLARLNFVTLGVTDLARATAFYAALGWTRSTASQAEIAFMRGDGDTGLILWSYDALAEDAALPPGRGSFGGQALAVNVPEEAYEIPLGKAATVRAGTDVTIVGVAMGVHQGLKAADELAKRGVSAEVIDLRTLVPLDRDHICKSVRKTGRLIVVDEDYNSYGVSGEIIASVVERDISSLKAPPLRVAYPDIPIPFSRPMEQWALPSAEKIVSAYDRMVKH